MRNVDAFVHRTGRTGRAGKSGRNIVMHAVDTGSFQFFQKLEESLKCRFKVCNAIMDTDGSYDAEDAANEVKNEEAQRLNRLEAKIKACAKPSYKLSGSITEQGEARVQELLHWFVDLDAEQQRHFLTNLLSEQLSRV